MTTLSSSRNPLVRWDWVTNEWDQIQEALLQHLQLTLLSVFYGTIISAFLAAIALRFHWAMTPVTATTGFLYTIPSVALFGLLVPYTGLNARTAIIALTSYTLLIIVTNTVAGFRSVPASVLEAANGMGLSPEKAGLHGRAPAGPALHHHRHSDRHRHDRRARHHCGHHRPGRARALDPRRPAANLLDADGGRRGAVGDHGARA